MTEFDLRSLLGALHDHGVEFVVIGGVAVGAHGFIRGTEDLEVRKELYQEVFRNLAEDIPYYPYLNNQNSYVMSPKVHGTAMYEDGILRVDLLWKSA